MRFRDRIEAGRALAERLSEYANRDDVTVLALPRGGVPIAFEVAQALGAPLDVFPVRKLGVPGREELAMGAIASGGVTVLNRSIIRELNIDEEDIATAVERESVELRRREQLYRGNRPPLDVAGRTVLLIDDGLATGATMKAAVEAVRELDPAEVIVAVPVAAAETCADLAELADHTICAHTPEPFFSVGYWYENFQPTTDEEVRDLLDRAHPGGDNG